MRAFTYVDTEKYLQVYKPSGHMYAYLLRTDSTLYTNIQHISIYVDMYVLCTYTPSTVRTYINIVRACMYNYEYIHISSISTGVRTNKVGTHK